MGDPSSSPWMSRKSTFLIALTLVAMIGVVQSEDFYELLGIERDADAKDIRRAFKRLALTMHPDKNQVNYLKDVYIQFFVPNKIPLLIYIGSSLIWYYKG